MTGRDAASQSAGVSGPLSFTHQGIRHVSSSHVASHHSAASFRFLLCQVLPALFCLSSLSTQLIPACRFFYILLSLLLLSLPSFLTCLLIGAALIFNSSCYFPSSHFPVDLLLCSASQLRPLTLYISHSLLHFSPSSSISALPHPSFPSPSMLVKDKTEAESKQQMCEL